MLVFALSLLTYWLTVEPAASWWDCPEYLTSALRLEVGHPPGNPVWTLTHRFASAFLPDTGSQVLAVNMMSGLFTALAAMLLCSVCQTLLRLLFYRKSRTRQGAAAIAVASGAGALCFAWSDSAWFSAVEAEVYAMSVFLTSLSVWIMVRWAFAPTVNARSRWLVLLGYITGLSVGVHQLNLLCIPALALIFVFRRMGRKRAVIRGLLAIAASFAIIACILLGMMPSMPLLAGRWEIKFVNGFGLPYNSGFIAYLAATMALAWTLPWVAYKSAKMIFPALLAAALLMMSGLTSLGGNLELGGVLAALLGVGIFFYFRIRRRAFQTAVWMMPMLLTGYCAYLLIPIRAWANPPMNQGAPSDPFNFYTYLQREQYGSAPLFYGRTPDSRPLMKERADIRHTLDAEGNLTASDTPWRYSDYERIPQGARYMRVAPGAVGPGRTGLLSPEERSLTDSLTKAGARKYVMADRRYKLVYTPELDMWFPRISSSEPADRPSFQAWAGMDTTTMTPLYVSETFDADGNPAGKRDRAGVRHKRRAFRPTYAQHLRMMLGYQFGYMYGRYLLWNFVGRQNDVSSSGEVDHGNFITGIPPVDSAMLGPQDKIPSEIGRDNPGRNIYFGIPLLLGIIGVVFLLTRGRGGRRMLAVVVALFLMTGIAIVFYLNQGPGEPRERDYSFLGSFWAYAVLIACGSVWMLLSARRSWLKIAAVAVSVGTPLLMLARNYDDHDRSGRRFVEAYAANILNTLPPNSILVVQGDNVTFPLWFAQEVKGIRRDVTIVNVAYMGLPSYIEQLRIPTAGSPGLALTMPRNLTIYGAYPYVGLPPASESEYTADAVETLRTMYEGNPGKPVLGAARLRLADGAVLDMNPEKTGSSSRWISLGNLVMADIIATNAASPDPRPLYWHQGVGWSAYAGAYPLTRREFSARRYAPFEEDEYLTRNLDSIASLLEWGGLDVRKNYYVDEVTERHARRMRQNLLFLALAQEREGRRRMALETVKEALKRVSVEKVPFGRALTIDSIVDETQIAEGLLSRLRIFDETSEADSLYRGLRLRDSLRRDEWNSYRRSLPPRLRRTLSPASRTAGL